MSSRSRIDNVVDKIGRRMMSRRKANQIRVLHSLETGKHTPHWLACCSAPTCCPMCSLFPCCTESEYVAVKRQASKYALVRENSIEWNDPDIVMKTGSCFGIDPCQYEIQDRVSVLYYDDPMFDRITDQTRFCNECRTCMCGGRGERIQIDSPCCFMFCQRASWLPFVPMCCPNFLVPCALRHEIYVEDAQEGLHKIQEARKAALQNPLYNDDHQALLDIDKGTGGVGVGAAGGGGERVALGSSVGSAGGVKAKDVELSGIV
jgi:hypothetical protein